MSKVDDELTRRLRRAERPVDADDLFEGLARRRSHRERVRKVQAGMLAFAVLAATAGGFVALRETFEPDDIRPAVSPSLGALAANGEIVFSAEGTDGYAHLYAMQPDGSGRRQITDFGTNDTDPAVSPDGQTIAFVHQLEDVDPALATIPIEGGTVTWLSDPRIGVRDPAWSPDGSTIAFVGTVDRTQRIMAFDMTSGEVSPIVDDRAEEFANPAWSPNGGWLVFSARASGTSDGWSLWTVLSNGTQRRQAGWTSPEQNAAAFSPDGTRIALLLLQGDPGEPDEIWTTTPDPKSDGLVTGGPPVALLTRSFEISLQPDIDWSPDGSTLLVSDGRWIYRVEPGARGDPRENLIRVAEGSFPAWQPLPETGAPLPTPAPLPSPSRNSELGIAEIGLEFRLCNASRLEGIDWFGDGRQGIAWIGAAMKPDGRCPNETSSSVLAADLHGDGIADTWTGIDECIQCEPWAATDLDGNGTEELVVMLFADIQPTFAFYFAVPDGRPRDSGIYPIFLEGPGSPEVGLRSEGIVTVQAGAGEEGISANAIRCEGYPEDPVLVVANWIKDEGTGAIAYHGARLKLEVSDDLVDAHFVMVDTFTPTATSEDFGGDGKACGVDFNPWN